MSTAATDHSTFSETSIERVREYCWSTIGPMVELKRVVLPAAR